MSFSVLVEDLVGVLVSGLILGAGLPALFALGVRLNTGRPVHGSHEGQIDAQTDSSVATALTAPVHPLRKAAAWLCFGVMATMIILGILWITKAVIYHSFGIDVFGTEAPAQAMALAGL